MWFLLAWTAPDRASAIDYFRHLCEIDPDNALARDGLAWSQTAWEDVRNSNGSGRAWRLQVRRGSAQLSGPAVLSARAVDHPAPPRVRTAPRQVGIPFAWVLVLYLLGIAAAELVTTYFNPQLGLVIHGSLLVLICLHASFGVQRAEQNFLFTLALAPLIRLLSLSMPLVQFKFSYWYAIIGVPLLLAAFVVLRLTGFKASDIGLNKGSITTQILIGLTGLGLGWIEYMILKPEPLVQSLRLKDIWLPVLILLVFTGFLEEFIFRGLMQRAAQGLMNKFAWLYISLLFAVLHIGYRSLLDFTFVLFVGLAFSLVVWRTRSLWGVTLAHGLTNIALYLIFPFIFPFM